MLLGTKLRLALGYAMLSGGLVVAAPERAPYADGMTLGQGFNTYLQASAVHDAVTVDTSPLQENPAQISYDAELISSYEQLAKVIDINAAASIEYLANKAEITAGFLNKKDFDESLLTYVIKVDVQKQPSTKNTYSFNWNNSTEPTVTYGDRFISDFVTGGALFARVSIKSTNSSENQNIKASAKTAFSIFKAGAKVSADAKYAIDTLAQKSEVSAHLYYVGAPPDDYAALAADSDDNPLLIQIKTEADDFLKRAAQHQWNRYALLEKYENVANWRREFKPLDYGDAVDLSWPVLNDYAAFLEFRDTIREIDAEHFQNGGTQKNQLQARALAAMRKYRAWIASVASKPENAESLPSGESYATFFRDLAAATQTTYVAQQKTIGKTQTDVISSKLSNPNKKLFDIGVFDFEGIPGTVKITFIQARGDRDLYRVITGREVIPDDFTAISHMWMAYTYSDAFDHTVCVVQSFIAGERISLQLDNCKLPPDGSELVGRFYG